MISELCTTDASSTLCTTTYASSSPQYAATYTLAYINFIFDLCIIFLVARKTIQFLR